MLDAQKAAARLCSSKSGSWKNLQNSHENIYFFSEVFDCKTSLLIVFPAWVFSSEFCEIFHNSFW